MFGRAKPFDDPDLGTLHRTHGAWRGTIRLDPHGPVPLVLPGSRSEPAPDALAVARSIPAEYDRGRAAIATALVEHRTTALEGENSTESDDLPGPTSAAVIELDRTLTVQFAYRVGWDDDHTLGACVRNGELVEFNGSILEP